MLNNSMSRKAEYEQDLNNKEVQRDVLLNQLEKTAHTYNNEAHTYNNEARKLKILPVGNKHSSGIDFGIKIDRGASRMDEVCTADHKAGSLRLGSALCAVSGDDPAGIGENSGDVRVQESISG